MCSEIREHIAGATYHTYSRCIAKENLMKEDRMKELMLSVNFFERKIQKI